MTNERNNHQLHRRCRKPPFPASVPVPRRAPPPPRSRLRRTPFPARTGRIPAWRPWRGTIPSGWTTRTTTTRRRSIAAVMVIFPGADAAAAATSAATTTTTTKRKKKMEMPRERPSDLVVIAMMARARMTRRMIKLRRKTQKRTMAAKARRRNAPKSAFLTKKPRLVTMTTRTTTCRMEHTKIQMTWFASTTQRKISGRSTEMKRRKQSLLNKIVVGSVPGGGWEVWEGWMEGKMMIIVMLLVLPGSWRRGTGWKEG
mmetsp:Transcript_7005/g.14472  ORF Transcript_7005/g.14472 Transcript_7005/m.14472 type:complete len:257 (-) Transcript_7005:2905-3675(-)